MLTKFIGKLLVVFFFMLTIISCGGNASVQEVVRSDPPASMTLIPIETSNSNSNEPGWERLEVETAVANSRSEFRFFVLDCEGNRGISVSSAESRQESSNWWFDSSCTIFTLPPGLIVRNPSAIAGKIPSGVTSIEFEVPYSDLQVGTFPQGAVASNSKARFNLDTDLVNPSTITFPVFEETVLNVHQSGETFELVDAKAQVSSIVQREGKTIFADIRLQNTNALDNAEFNRIMVYGAGSDGILREAEVNGGSCQPPLVGNQRTNFILNTIGPNQTTSCNVKFSNVPSNVENFHVWFSLYRHATTETNIIDGGTVHQSSSPSSTSSSSTTTGTSTSSQGNVTRGESLYKSTIINNSAPGCITCHSLEPDVVIVGPSHAGIGERIAGGVNGLSAEDYLRQSILEPNSHVVNGFTEGIMYQDFSTVLSPQDVDDLVAFLLKQ